MPSYYNPYYGPTYTPQQYGWTGSYSQSYGQPPIQQNYTMASPKNIEWVDGQIGAIAYQMPAGWPANLPIALWDSTKQVIYWKSWNQVGAPNQLIEIPYSMPNSQNNMLVSGQSGENSGSMSGNDMNQYATRQEFEQLKQEIHNMNRSGANNNGGGGNSGNNQNGSNNNGNSGMNNGNRGGNR